MARVVIYMAEWCSICRGTIKRIVPALSEEDIEYEIVDVDSSPRSRDAKSITHLPTVCVVDAGERELMRCRGCPTDDVLEKIVELCIESD